MANNSRGLKRESQKLQKLVRDKTGTEINYTTALRMLEELKNNRDEKFQKTADIILNLQKFDTTSSIYKEEIQQIITTVLSMVTHMSELSRENMPDRWKNILLDDYSDVNANIKMFYNIIQVNNLEKLVNDYTDHFPDEKNYVISLINGGSRRKHCLSELRGTLKDYLDVNSIEIGMGIVAEEQIFSNIMDGKSVLFINEESGYGDFIQTLSEDEQSIWYSVLGKLARAGKEYNTKLIISAPKLTAVKNGDSFNGIKIEKVKKEVWNNEQPSTQPIIESNTLSNKLLNLPNNETSKNHNAIFIGYDDILDSSLWHVVKNKYDFDDKYYNKYNSLSDFCALLNNENNANTLEKAEEIFIDFRTYHNNSTLFTSVVAELIPDKLVYIMMDNGSERSECALNEFRYLMGKNKNYSDPISTNTNYYVISYKNVSLELDDAKQSRKYAEQSIHEYLIIKNVIESNAIFKDNFIIRNDYFRSYRKIFIEYNISKSNKTNLVLLFLKELLNNGINNSFNIIIREIGDQNSKSNYNELLKMYNLI